MQGFVPACRRRRHLRLLGAAAVLWMWTCFPAYASPEELHTAMTLAEMLRSARTVVSNNQDRINDPSLGDKGLTGDVVLAEAIKIFEKTTGSNPTEVDPNSQLGRLLQAQMLAIRQVVDENQQSINLKGMAFKGFIPAVFARLVNERFEELAKGEAEIKVTAPPELVRNRKAFPDQWEKEMIASKLGTADWMKGEPYAATSKSGERPAFRVLVPEYYTPSCLTCHGEPKGEVDITGYPKEGGHVGDLGAIISITLFE